MTRFQACTYTQPPIPCNVISAAWAAPPRRGISWLAMVAPLAATQSHQIKPRNQLVNRLHVAIYLRPDRLQFMLLDNAVFERLVHLGTQVTIGHPDLGEG